MRSEERKGFDFYTFFCVLCMMTIVWQQTEVTLYGYSQESVMDTFIGLVLSFYITREMS